MRHVLAQCCKCAAMSGLFSSKGCTVIHRRMHTFMWAKPTLVISCLVLLTHRDSRNISDFQPASVVWQSSQMQLPYSSNLQPASAGKADVTGRAQRAILDHQQPGKATNATE